MSHFDRPKVTSFRGLYNCNYIHNHINKFGAFFNLSLATELTECNKEINNINLLIEKKIEQQKLKGGESQPIIDGTKYVLENISNFDVSSIDLEKLREKMTSFKRHVADVVDSINSISQDTDTFSNMSDITEKYKSFIENY